jgi:GR25 family glycosyltransferase involved in LPS biosynthesis
MRSTKGLKDVFGPLRALAFRVSRVLWSVIPAGQISAFGTGAGKIGMVMIINLDRQPRRLRRTMRELNRYKTFDGLPLWTISHRLPAIDARDGREVASTSDVDQTYRLAHQLFVQPDTKLEECFDPSEPIRMTRQEVAVARSHIETWKAIASGQQEHVLVLEDDIWFARGAAAAIDRGWRESWQRLGGHGGPDLLYFSYEDAGGTAARLDACDAVFRPLRGLWFLSGYVLSRRGARTLLESMPVVGPVDMWINYCLEKLKALALSSPVVLQRDDGGSDNSHSILPYLARAGIVDANSMPVPKRSVAGPVFAWTAKREREGLAMALSMLGLRVRVFDGDEKELGDEDLASILTTFDALVDAPLSGKAFAAITARSDSRFVLEGAPRLHRQQNREILPPSRTVVFDAWEPNDAMWQPLCALLGLAPPPYAFPAGAPRSWRILRDDRHKPVRQVNGIRPERLTDDSAWALVPDRAWPTRTASTRSIHPLGDCLVNEAMTTPTPILPAATETFPGNRAAFNHDGLLQNADGAQLVLSKVESGNRKYRSGAFASVRSFEHGRFEAEIRPACGTGLVTGFFLHRASPRQEIDIELTGDDPRRMLLNVYFNPGDDGSAIEFGYRGSPCRIDLGFNAASDFHLYAIDWRPGCITWSVDGEAVHQRVGWDPTPLPYLPMRLHANLWAPRSEALAGVMNDRALPATATFRNIKIWA